MARQKSEPARVCPPHHWLITGLARRGEQWTCVRCHAQRDLEPKRTHISAHWQAQADSRTKVATQH